MSNSPGEKRICQLLIQTPLLITVEMLAKSICKKKNGKAYSPSCVVTEMLKASSDICSELIADLRHSIVQENAMPSE